MSCSKWLCNYPNDILVETGSGGGGGIEYALRYGFKEIHSIEIDKGSHSFCLKKFRGNKAVNLYLGDSIDVLPQILSKINTKATFLLDAHVMNFEATHGKVICPVLEELKIIINHGKQNGIKHSLLIDDAKFFNGAFEAFGNIKLADIEKTIIDLDPSYVIHRGRKSIGAL